MVYQYPILVKCQGLQAEVTLCQHSLPWVTKCPLATVTSEALNYQ